MFYVGQRVICVDDNANIGCGFLLGTASFNGDLNGLKKGGIYTIRDVGWFENANLARHLGVRLQEIKRGRSQAGGYEQPFLAHRFRPIVERKTSIEIFKAMLSPKTEEIDA